MQQDFERIAGIRHGGLWLLGLSVLAVAALWLSLSVGSAGLDGKILFYVLRGEEPGTARDWVLGLRLPRALAAFGSGALLGLAGTLMQVLLRNPLADPYVLGISGGAGAAALGAMVLGWGALGVNVAAFLGAVATMLAVVWLARGNEAWTSTRLLLTGVMVGAGWGAVVSLLLALAPDARLRGMLFWLMGDLGSAGAPGWSLAAAVIGLAVTLPAARHLNVLGLGETTAFTLGVPVARLRWHLYLTASLLTAVAVTTVGSVGFVGLVVPHAVRLLVGNDQRVALPASALAGGAGLVLADTLARTVVAPQQLPVGVVTALIGVPAFLYLFSRRVAR